MNVRSYTIITEQQKIAVNGNHNYEYHNITERECFVNGLKVRFHFKTCLTKP